MNRPPGSSSSPQLSEEMEGSKGMSAIKKEKKCGTTFDYIRMKQFKHKKGLLKTDRSKKGFMKTVDKYCAQYWRDV